VCEQLKAEADMETLAALLDSWNETLAQGSESAGAKLTPEQLQECMVVCQLLIKESMERRAERAQAEGDEADEDDEEQREAEAETEEVLVQNIVETIGALLKVYHSAVLPLFDSLLLGAFQAMLQPSAISADRVAALCVFDDIIEHCSADGGAGRYIGVLFPAFLQYAQDTTAEVRQAAVYGLGVLGEHAGSAEFTEQMQQQAATTLLAMIEHPQAFDEENASASDNAVSAFGKLCRRSPAIAAAGLPRWLAKLPLESDQEEARSVHGMLVTLVEETNANLLGASNERLPDIICIFGQTIGTKLVEPEVETRMGNILKQVRAGLPHVLGALPSHPGFAKLSAEQKGRLEAALSS
jgi:hypothetical protein